MIIYDNIYFQHIYIIVLLMITNNNRIIYFNYPNFKGIVSRKLGRSPVLSTEIKINYMTIF